MNNSLHSYAFGIATKNIKGEIIEVYYPFPRLRPCNSEALKIVELFESLGGLKNGYLQLQTAEENNSIQKINDLIKNQEFLEQVSVISEVLTSKNPILTLQLEDNPPINIPQAFLKLHLLSHRLVKPNTINLNGIFGVLKNIAWTNQGAIDLEDLPARQLNARKKCESIDIISVDKFPKMTNYVIPKGIRIADTSRVRLGAYIGEGTTIMHEGFVNFNAGTEGAAMIEGRISAGVIVGNASDLGGGCSTMGTLSGGGTELVSVGENCLIGANAGIGFPLADGCIVEAGLYVTAGTKVNLLNDEGDLIKVAKAKEISEIKNLLFRRNSLSGAVECAPIKNAVNLNEELHSHN